MTTPTSFISSTRQKSNQPTVTPGCQVAKLGFDGNSLTCDRDAEFDFVLKPPASRVHLGARAGC